MARLPSFVITISCGPLPVGSVARVAPDATSTIVALLALLLTATRVPLTSAVWPLASPAVMSPKATAAIAACLKMG